MAKTYKEFEKELLGHIPKKYEGRKEFIRELQYLQGDDQAKIAQTNAIAMRFFPEPKEDWMLSVRLLAQNGEL